MIIKIDSRETSLLQQILIQKSIIPSFKNIELKSENLPIGDIIISDGLEDKIIIERKTVTDLLSSIKDGRYEEQSYRLNGLENNNHNIIYLIEGDLKENRFKQDKQIDKFTLYSAMFSLNYYKGFSVFRSFSLEETANIICNMAYKIEKETLKGKLPYYQNKNGYNKINIDKEIELENIQMTEQIKDNNEKDYINVVKKVKKENVTLENIDEIMLCQIPGISSVTALAIIEKYGNISNLIKELETNSITDLSYTNSKGQLRKINKISLANIVKYLLKKI